MKIPFFFSSNRPYSDNKYSEYDEPLAEPGKVYPALYPQFGGSNAKKLDKNDILEYNRLCSENKWDIQNNMPRSFWLMNAKDREIAYKIYYKMDIRNPYFETKLFPMLNKLPRIVPYLMATRFIVLTSMFFIIPKVYEWTVPASYRCKLNPNSFKFLSMLSEEDIDPLTVDDTNVQQETFSEIISNDTHETNGDKQETVNGNNSELDGELQVDISDALSERNKVKYTVHTKTTFSEFSKSEISVVREHDEFIWLHNCLEDCEDYAGFIIPPAPPRPDFDSSREKLQKLGENEATMTKDEFAKMKQELEQEYLALFKKTVAMHEFFLCRLAAHPVFRKDSNFRIFLEYENNLSVRGKNKKEVFGSIFKRFTQTADEVLLSGQKDIDEFFDCEKNYMVEYSTHIKEAMIRSDKVCRLRQSTTDVADSYTRIAHGLEKFGQLEGAGGEKEFGRFLIRTTELFEKMKKAEARVGTDEELKEADTFRYFMRESQAAMDLLYRRRRCLANYEASNKNLERCRARNRDIPKAEKEQEEACKKFEDISKLAKTELLELKKTRISAFKRNLADLADLEIKQSNVIILYIILAKIILLQSALRSLKSTPEEKF
ncbi:Sorting nexin [Meloidogyne graminicola]|uniref:Sorting nexin n=1 Tax=Meloidogyne graminicola TaxID=189291 RepID=A0A8S9ZW54_9BILA|nr:Sorting nexin [Meloidogyne graminicola]